MEGNNRINVNYFEEEKTKTANNVVDTVEGGETATASSTAKANVAKGAGSGNIGVDTSGIADFLKSLKYLSSGKKADGSLMTDSEKQGLYAVDTNALNKFLDSLRAAGAISNSVIDLSGLVIKGESVSKDGIDLSAISLKDIGYDVATGALDLSNLIYNVLNQFAIDADALAAFLASLGVSGYEARDLYSLIASSRDTSKVAVTGLGYKAAYDSGVTKKDYSQYLGSLNVEKEVLDNIDIDGEWVYMTNQEYIDRYNQMYDGMDLKGDYAYDSWMVYCREPPVKDGKLKTWAEYIKNVMEDKERDEEKRIKKLRDERMKYRQTMGPILSGASSSNSVNSATSELGKYLSQRLLGTDKSDVLVKYPTKRTLTKLKGNKDGLARYGEVKIADAPLRQANLTASISEAIENSRCTSEQWNFKTGEAVVTIENNRLKSFKPIHMKDTGKLPIFLHTPDSDTGVGHIEYGTNFKFKVKETDTGSSISRLSVSSDKSLYRNGQEFRDTFNNYNIKALLQQGPDFSPNMYVATFITDSTSNSLLQKVNTESVDSAGSFYDMSTMYDSKNIAERAMLTQSNSYVRNVVDLWQVRLQSIDIPQVKLGTYTMEFCNQTIQKVDNSVRSENKATLNIELDENMSLMKHFMIMGGFHGGTLTECEDSITGTMMNTSIYKGRTSPSGYTGCYYHYNFFPSAFWNTHLPVNLEIVYADFRPSSTLYNPLARGFGDTTYAYGAAIGSKTSYKQITLEDVRFLGIGSSLTLNRDDNGKMTLAVPILFKRISEHSHS